MTAKTHDDSDQIERVRIGRRLREARKYLGFKQAEIAVHLDIQRTALSEIESGSRRVEAVELKKLARLYGQPVSHFVGDDVSTSDLPADIAHLAREAEGLSESDRSELVQFASFLKSRSKQGG